MTFSTISGLGDNASGRASAVDAQTDKLLQGAKASASGASNPAASREAAKELKAGEDFESILLGSWLTQAENTFAKVPGGDEDEDADAGKNQFQGIAMQALAGSLTAHGGIGIAKMIAKHLQQIQKETSSATDAKRPVAS